MSKIPDTAINLHQELVWKSESSNDYVNREHLFYDANTQRLILFTGTPTHTCYYTQYNDIDVHADSENGRTDDENDIKRNKYVWQSFSLDLSSCHTIDWSLLSCNMTPDRRYVSIGISDKEIKIIECSSGKVVAARAVKANNICIMIGSYWIKQQSTYTHTNKSLTYTPIKLSQLPNDNVDQHILFVTSLGCEQYRLVKSPPLLSTASPAKQNVAASSATASSGTATPAQSLQHRLLHIKTIPLSNVTMHWMLYNTLILMNHQQQFYIYQLSTHYHTQPITASASNVNTHISQQQLLSNTTKKKDYIELTLPFKVTKHRNIQLIQLYNNSTKHDVKHIQQSNTPFLCAIDEIDCILRIYSLNWQTMQATELFTYASPQQPKQPIDKAEQSKPKFHISIVDNVIVLHDSLTRSATLIDTHTDSNRVLLTDVKMSYISSSKHASAQQHTSDIASPTAVTMSMDDNVSPSSAKQTAMSADDAHRRLYSAYNDAKFLYPSSIWQTLGEQYHGRLFTLTLNYDVCNSLIAKHLSPQSALSFLLKRTANPQHAKTVCLRLIHSTVEQLLINDDKGSITTIHQMFAAVNLVWSDVTDKDACADTTISDDKLTDTLDNEPMKYTHDLILQQTNSSATSNPTVQNVEHFNQHLLINQYDLFSQVFAPSTQHLNTERNIRHMISIVVEYIQSLLKHSLPVSPILSSYITSLLIRNNDFHTLKLFYDANILPPSVVAATQMLQAIKKIDGSTPPYPLIESTALHMLRTFIDHPLQYPAAHVYASKVQYYSYMLHSKHDMIIELLREAKEDQELFNEERLKPIEWLNIAYSMVNNDMSRKYVDKSELVFYWCYMYFQRQTPDAVIGFQARFDSLFTTDNSSSSVDVHLSNDIKQMKVST